MDSFKVEIAGDRQVGLRLDAFPDELYAELKGHIEALGAELLARVEAATPRRTGKLAESERLRIFADPQRIKAQVDVSADFAKAGALEYGAHGGAHVHAHSMRLDHAWAERLAAPISVLVSAYTRTVDIAEVAFERGPLAGMSPEILAQLDEAVEKRVAATNA